MTKTEKQTVLKAIQILEKNVFSRSVMENPTEVKNYLRLQLEPMDREAFIVMFLDTRLGLIEAKTLFQGTLNSAEVHPRVIAKEALLLNAYAVILGHNHPSGNDQPSPADLHITARIKDALELFDIRVLDHVIVANGNTLSFAERGLI